MQGEFEMSVMGELSFFLGLQIKQRKDGIFINQAKYIKEKLKKFGMENVKPQATPMSSSIKLDKDEEGKCVDSKLYRSMIGLFLYLTASRPDIMFSGCLCARFQANPKESHLKAVKRIFRYLQDTPSLGLWYPRDSTFDLHAYSDADYGGCKIDRKSTSDQDEPKTYQEAVVSPDSEKWLEAMRSEMDSMSDNQVWTLVEPPEGIKPIGCKWVFKKKTDMDGNVQTYKGRLVAKGFRQIHGVDYDETFSPVAMFKSIRILLAVAAFHDYEIWQMDVKTAFLNEKLEEDVYMTQPEGFVTPKNARNVCKLQRSIYGLKQASRSWNLRFNEAIQEFGFIRNEDEPCVYKKFSGSIVSFLILYVDDILIIGNDTPTLQSIKTWLSSCFSKKDLGEATYILGVKIYRDRSRRLLGLSQSTYIDKVLKRFRMEESKRGFLPMRHGISLSKEMCPSTPQERQRMIQIPYASAIGSIMYAMICTRPDLSYALSMTSRYQANPSEDHWTAVKNILKYLRRTKDVFLVYGGEEELRIKGYTDASFQTDKDDSRSQSGFVFCLNKDIVS
ncbi:hypothetical protein GQ457_15G018400 [Hibiscus cannabinus]